MPAPAIITVVVVALIWMSFIVFAVNRRTILGPEERRTTEALDLEQVDQ